MEQVCYSVATFTELITTFSPDNNNNNNDNNNNNNNNEIMYLGPQGMLRAELFLNP